MASMRRELAGLLVPPYELRQLAFTLLVAWCVCLPRDSVGQASSGDANLTSEKRTVSSRREGAKGANGTFSEKLRRLVSRIEHDEKNVLLRYELAKQYNEEGFREESIVEYEKVVSATPYFVDALVELGQAYLLAKRFGDSEQVLSRALALNPDNVAAMSGLAILHYFGASSDKEVGFVRSMELLRLALQKDPENMNIRTSQASIVEEECYRVNGSHCEDALALWKSVSKKTSSSYMQDLAGSRIRVIQEHLDRVKK